MNKNISKPLQSSLKKLYSTSPSAKGLFDRLGDLKKDVRQTTVDNAVRFAKCRPREMRELFKDLEDLELGRYVVGRRGSVTRFEWDYRTRTVAAAAKGEGPEPLTIDDGSDLDDDLYFPADFSSRSEEWSEEELLEHIYLLRKDPDRAVRIKLPRDLSQKEADRFSDFIRTLAFED